LADNADLDQSGMMTSDQPSITAVSVPARPKYGFALFMP
jgi:hypothetical protein